MSELGNKEIMAKNIRRYMELKGKDRNKICKDLGFKYTTFTDWINGNTYPRIDKIELMANYFGISKSDLVEEHSDTIQESELPPDPDIRRIQRARQNMPECDKEFMMQMLERSFSQYFMDDGEDDPD